jgi:hypothetical protein
MQQLHGRRVTTCTTIHSKVALGSTWQMSASALTTTDFGDHEDRDHDFNADTGFAELLVENVVIMLAIVYVLR